jgi:hypothetical protein
VIRPHRAHALGGEQLSLPISVTQRAGFRSYRGLGVVERARGVKSLQPVLSLLA